MTLHINALFAANTRAFAAFIAMDFLLEYLIESLLSIRVKDLLTQADFGPGFTITYFAMLYIGLTLILIIYALVRPRFKSRWRAGLVTGGIMYLYTGLFMTQMLNFGLMPTKLFAISAAVNSIELPIALFVGIVSYPDSPSADVKNQNPL
jgi:hypothetical protein